MPRILLGHDFGDGFGHLAILAPLAQALRDRGCETLLAVRDPVLAWARLQDSGSSVVQAPWSQISGRFRGTDRRLASFADLLVLYGLDEAERANGLTLAWRGLLDTFRPDLVIGDFAPILTLAALGRVPVVHVGSGYTNPPAYGDGFPPLRDLPAWLLPDKLMAVLDEARRHGGLPPLGSLAALARPEATFITCLSWLDPYAAYRPEPTLGPLHPLPAPAPAAPETDWFAYLSATYQGSSVVLEALLSTGLRGHAYLRDASPAIRRHWRDRGLVVHDRPPALAEAAGRAALVIQHGGISTTESVLAIGRPQLFVPRHIEQVLTMRQAIRHGGGSGMKPDGAFTGADVNRAIDAIRQDDRHHERARALAGQIERDGPYHGLDRVIDRCLELTRQ